MRGSLGPLWSALGLSAALALVHGVASRGFYDPARKPELAAYDLHYVLRNRIRPPDPPHEKLVLLAYDDDSLALERSSISPHHTTAKILEKLADQEAGYVFVDLRLDQPYLLGIGARIDDARRLLPPDATAADRALRDIVDELMVDERIAAAMKRVPTLLMLTCSPGPEPREIPEDVRSRSDPLEPPARYGRALQRSRALQMPLPVYRAAARHIAHSCEFPDPDGVLRTDPSILAVPSQADRTRDPLLVPSAALQIARQVTGEEASFDGEALLLGERRFPLGSDGALLLGLSGPAGSFRGRQGLPARYSVAQLLRGDIPEGRLRGRVVLLGDTLVGSRDTKLTSFGYGARGRMSGVEKIAMHANYLSTATHPIHRPPFAQHWGFLLTLCAGAIAAIAGARLAFYPALALVLPGALVIFAAGTAALVAGGVWIDTAYPAITWSTALVGAALVRYSQEVGARRYLESAFERYLPREMVRAIVRDPSMLKLAGEEKEMTVLFADLRGFTTFSEGHTAGEVVAHLNDHLTAMSEIIQKHGGTVDKFIGDAVMAFWNAPLADPQHAAHACEAAREMLAALDRRNEVRIVRGQQLVDMGIGINTGPMIVGNMGSARRFNYTVIGDAVNLASRLESITKDYQERVIVGPRTRQLAGAAFQFRALGEVTVKGKQERVPVHALVESAPAAAPQAAPRSNRRA